MDEYNINRTRIVVYYCGEYERNIYIYKNNPKEINIGCFKGSKKQAINTISKKYTNPEDRDAYIKKINLAFSLVPLYWHLPQVTISKELKNFSRTLGALTTLIMFTFVLIGFIPRSSGKCNLVDPFEIFNMIYLNSTFYGIIYLTLWIITITFVITELKRHIKF